MTYNKRRAKQYFLDEEFGKMLKAEAATKGISLIELSRRKAEKIKKEKGGFSFEF